MLVDEPTLGLAPKMVDLIAELLKVLNQKGIQILLVEEDLKASVEVATTLYLMRGGEIVISGPTEEIQNEIRRYLEERA